MGPLVSAKQRERVLGYIEKGKDEGARVVAGGGRPEQSRQGLLRAADAVRRRRQRHDHRARGDLRAGAHRHPVRRRRRRRPHRQRQPVRARRVRHVGLEERALAVGEPLRAGTVSINGGVTYGADAPFGGYKASGVGRQNGIEGFQQYTETKTFGVSIPS